MFCEVCLCSGYHLAGCPEDQYADDEDIADLEDEYWDRKVDEIREEGV